MNQKVKKRLRDFLAQKLRNNSSNKIAPCNPCTNKSDFSLEQNGQVPSATMNFNNSPSSCTCCACHPSTMQYFNNQNPESAAKFPQNRNQLQNSNCNLPSSSNNSSLLLQRALSSGCQHVRDITPVTNEMTAGSCEQGPALLTDVQRSMTDTYRRIQTQYLTKEQEIQNLRTRWEDVSLVNDKLKKEITQLKRERTMSAKEMEKLKKQIEDGEQRTQENLQTITQQQNELDTQKEKIDNQLKEIRVLEKKNAELETKQSHLISNQVDQTVEALLAQNEKEKLSGHIATLKRNLQAKELKIKSLTKKCCVLMREKEKLNSRVKIQEVELQAEKLLREQIVSDEMSILMKPSLLNMLMTHNNNGLASASSTRAVMSNTASNDVEKKSPRQDYLMVPRDTFLRLNEATHVEKPEQPTGLKQEYDHLISEIEKLKEHLGIEDQLQKRKLCNRASSSTTIEKKRRINSDQLSLDISEFSESGLGEDESVTEDDALEPDLILIDDDDDEVATGSGSMVVSQNTQTRIDDMLIMGQKSASVGRTSHEDLAS